jgi:hypothetical protein
MSNPTKVSVLANGTVLVDGVPATLEELDTALAGAKHVWYYREAARGEPPPIARDVIQRLIARKLPITLSSKPDFSDWVDAKGVSHQRGTPAPGGSVRMPDVEERGEMDEYFATVRRTAAGRGEGEGLVIVKPDRTLMVLPRMAESPQLKKMADDISQIVPPAKPRNIAAIAYTEFEAGPQGVGLAEVGRAIPFLGMLVGLSYIGHAVWVFEGHASAIAAGCRDADLLIVDSAMRPLLVDGWDAQAASVMRSVNIVVHSRATFQLSAVQKMGDNPSGFEFSE